MDGYNHVLDNSAIRHTLKQHGGRDEVKRGQIPITEEDLDRLPDVVENYDDVRVENGKRDNIDNIIYSKSYPDSTTIYAEEKRDKRKELAAVTMWKTKNTTLTDANRDATPISDLSGVVSADKGADLFGNEQGSGRKSSSDGKIDDEQRVQELASQLEEGNTAKNDALIQQIADMGTAVSERWLDENVRGQKVGFSPEAGPVNNAERLVVEAFADHLNAIGVGASTDWETGQRVLDEVNSERVPMSKGKKRAMETASVTQDEEHQHAVISFADGAKVGNYSETETPSSAETVGSTATETGEKLGVKLTDADLRYILWRSHENMTENGIFVSDIRGLFPKDNVEWLNWISQGKSLYMDKEKNQILIAQQQINPAEVDYLDLDDVQRKVESFKNPNKGIKQGFGSANTSLNQIPAAMRKIAWEEGSTNVDI